MPNSPDPLGIPGAEPWRRPGAQPARSFAGPDGLRAYASPARDRRNVKRYPLRLGLIYEQTELSARDQVPGHTSDISSHSVLFTAEPLPPVGSIVEARIQWPVRIGGAAPLQLVIYGPVLKRDSRGAVLLIKRYGFSAEGDSASAPLSVPAKARERGSPDI